MPSLPVVAVNVLATPFGRVTTTVVVAPAARSVPFVAPTVIETDPYLAVRELNDADAVTTRLAGGDSVTDPVAEPARPLPASLAATVNGNVPNALLGAVSVSAVDAVAPDASVADAGENEAVHPAGTVADIVNSEAAQAEVLLFLTATAKVVGEVAFSETEGVAAAHTVARAMDPDADPDLPLEPSVAVTLNA
jgi:hypothetical protein